MAKLRARRNNGNIILWIFLVGVIALALAAGCGGEARDEAGGTVRVVATTGMIADAVRMIAGDSVELAALMGPGVDPHLYKATKGDIDRLSQANVIFFNGLNLEAKMADILRQMPRSKAAVAVGEAVPEGELRHPAEFQGHPDPHIWFDVSLWRHAVERIAQTLIERDAKNAEYYRGNAAAYLDSLDALHRWVQEQMQQIPPERRMLVTAHDAFGYFGQAYGIEVQGLQGISTVTEAGLYDITHMIDMIVERKIPAVFVESSVPRKSIEAVVAGCLDRGHEVAIGGQLFSDAMGEAGTPEGTYLGMVRHNVNAIVEALGSREYAK